VRLIPLTLKLLVAALCLAAWQPITAAEEISPDTQPEFEIWLPNLFVDYQNFVVDPKDRQASLDFYNKVYLASADVDPQWTGNHEACDAGATSREYKAAVRLRVNYFRAMAGVPADIMFSQKCNRMAQQAALMMSRNGDLDHFPPVGWQCYTDDGATAAGSSNLSMGRSGAEAVTGQMEDEGENNAAVGHRRWILCPQSRTFGTGDVPGTADYRFWPANALWVVDDPHYYDPRPATRDEFVAWPPPGYVPGPLVFPRWSFSYGRADFTKATVEMMSNGIRIPVRLEPLAYNVCENTLVWAPDVDWRSLNLEEDRTFTVKIRNIWIEGKKRSFDYSVTVFDTS
jgi:hypothetical protein